jgi:hypothetical protein
MHELLHEVIEAHGGLDRWNSHSTLLARVRGGGSLWRIKGQDGVLGDYRTRITMHEQKASHGWPGGGLTAEYTPARVAIEDADGTALEQRHAPAAAFDGRDLSTPWDRLHLAFFTGFAMWSYLTEPFSLAGDTVEATELEPWHEGTEMWRRLKIDLPADMVGHHENVYYIDRNALIRRHDYIAPLLGRGAMTAAHMTSGHESFDGLVFPTERRVYRIDENNRPITAEPTVSISLSNITFI